MAEKAYNKRYKIRRGLLKGVGLKGRHRRLLKREFKKTLRSYVGRRATLAAGAAAALVGRKIKTLQERSPSGKSLTPKALPDRKQPK